MLRYSTSQKYVDISNIYYTRETVEGIKLHI
jgi:hypothetical protein